MNGELNPGDRLPSEREMGERFGVSRTAVREAVKALHERGLVDIQPGRGSFIADFAATTADIMRDSLSLLVRSGYTNSSADLIQVREIIEPALAALAAENATPEEIEALRAAVLTMDEAIEDAERFVEADLQFHLLLAEATHNPLLPLLINPIVELLREQRQRIFNTSGGARRGQQHHRAILRAVIARDPAAAHSAMLSHIAQVTADSRAPGGAGANAPVVDGAD